MARALDLSKSDGCIWSTSAIATFAFVNYGQMRELCCLIPGDTSCLMILVCFVFSVLDAPDVLEVLER